MATSRNFQDMLNDHLSYDLLDAEWTKRDWLYSFVEKDQTWLGGDLIVPFRGSKASSVSFGSLTAAADINQSVAVRGSVTSYKEMWGSLVFNETDLIQHNRLSEANFLKLLPDEIDRFMDTMKQQASVQMLNGFYAKATGDGDASGNITVNCPERFDINQAVYVDDDNSSVSAVSYVRTINLSTGVITLYDAASGGSVVNLSGYTVAQNAKIYLVGTQPGTAVGFTSLREQLLSAANGGSSTIAGQTKTAYPFLQSINLDGSAFTEDNILEGVFNKFVVARGRCSGNPRNLVCSYKNGAAILKNVEVQRGAYASVPGSNKASPYGWTEVEIGGPKGLLKLIMVQEMEDDVMFLLSDKGIKFHSNGGFRKRVGPDGISFYTTRATTGYTYIQDLCVFGDLVVYQPSAHAVIHSISFSLSEA